MSYGDLKYVLDRGISIDDGGSDGPDPIPAAHQNSLGAWVNADTGKIVTYETAMELLGRNGRRHAEKCECLDCTADNDGDPREDWE